MSILLSTIGDWLYDTKCRIYHKFFKRDPNRPMRLGTRRRKNMVFYICMMAIPVIQFCIMWIGVNFNAITLSFQEYDSQMNASLTLNNYGTVIDNFMHDRELQLSLCNSALFYLVTTIITLPTSLFIAFYLYKKWAFSDKIRLLLIVPSMIASVVMITCFYYLADRGWPLLVQLFTGRTDTLGLLVNSETKLPTLVGFNVFISLSGSYLFFSNNMSGIDTSISEAAQLDGCNMFQEFIYITIPMIFPMLSTIILVGLSGSLIGDHGMYAFSQTGGSAVPTMGYYFTVYVTQGGAERRYPYFSALGIILSAMTCVIVFSAKAAFKRMDPYKD